MPILLQCPQCKARMKAPDGSEGRKAKCPRCGTLIPILAASESPEGGEEDVEGGEDAGMFSTAKKTPSKKMPAPSASKSKTNKSDFDFVKDDEDEDDPPPRKGRKIVEEDDDEDDRPVRKGRAITEDDEDEDDSAGFQDEDDEEEDRPRKKKKKKKRRRRSSSAEDVDPALIENGWNMIKGSFGIAVFGFCCCWPASLVGIFMSLAAVGIGIMVMVKGDAGTGGLQAFLGFIAFCWNTADFFGGMMFAASGGYDNL